MSLEIQDLMQQVRRLRITTPHRVEDLISGEYHSVFRGHGIEFDEVREYAYGDDIRGIDWNVTARMGHPYIKRHREERELTLILMVDISASLNFGTKGRSKSDTAALLAGLLALSADRNQDKTGLILFGDQVEKYIPPSRGRRTVMRVLREILAAATTGRRTNIGQALRFLRRVHKRRAAVFLISDFLDPEYEHELSLCARHHDVIACRLCDTDERELPPVGLLETVDPETGAGAWIDTSARRNRARLNQWFDEQDQRLVRACRRHRIDILDITNKQQVADAVFDFFRKRRRRLMSARFANQNLRTGSQR